MSVPLRSRSGARKIALAALVCLGLLAVPALSAPLQAADLPYTTTFVPLSGSVPGVLYAPKTAQSKASVGIAIMHPFASYLNFVGCGELATRGYTVLCANPHTVNQPSNYYTIEEQAPDVALAVKYLRSQPGIKKVLLGGHSAGGPMMAFYQAVAENGPAVCQDPEKITPCPDGLAGLPAADGMILFDSHGGYGFTTLTYVDPAVTDNSAPQARDASLDMYDPANGYDRAGANYSPEFLQRFMAAQGERNNRLIAQALERRDAIAAGQGQYPDDEPFVVNGVRARIWQPDLHLQSHTHDPHPLIHPDGSVTTQVVPSVRPPSGGAAEAKSYNPAALEVSVNQFLSSSATYTTPDYNIGEDTITGVDWASSSSNTPWAVEHISVPLLIMPMTGHYFLVTDEVIYNHAASADKQIAYVEGAVHGITTCKACEQFPGQYGDTVKTAFNFADGWLAAHFVS